MPPYSPRRIRGRARFGCLAATLALLAIAGGAAYGVRSGFVAIPDEWNPWAPLRIEQPINWLTRLKLARVSADDALCKVVLATADMRYEAVADREVSPGCGFDNAVRIRATSAAVGEPFTLSCRSAVALGLWERHVLQPFSRAYFGAPIARIEHLGSYACRNVYGRKDAALSRHATADALDVAGFVTANGHRVRVAADWKKDTVESRFLHDVRDGACRVFGSVLSPDYNAAHADHFHLDTGAYRVCR